MMMRGKRAYPGRAASEPIVSVRVVSVRGGSVIYGLALSGPVASRQGVRIFDEHRYELQKFTMGSRSQ